MEQGVQLTTRDEKGAKDTAQLIYILYLASCIFGISALIGVVLAYVYKKDAPDWIATHHRFQIRTFWMLVLFGFVGTITTPFLIGFLILVGGVVWLIVRCAIGMKELGSGAAKSNVASWWI